MTFFSDRDGARFPGPSSAEINEGAWQGLCAVLQRTIAANNLARDYPLRCPDNGAVHGTDEATLHDEWGSLVPDLDLPLRRREAPPTAVAMDAVEFIARHVRDVVEAEGHPHFGHRHLRFPDGTAARKRLAVEVNEVLRRNRVALRLRDDGRAQRTGPPVVAAALHAWDRRTGDDTVDDLLTQTRREFLDPDPAERPQALKTLWDAWDRLKTVLDPDKKTGAVALVDRAANDPALRAFNTAEARALREAGNQFMIRHSETTQVPLETEAQADYLFSQLWALIELLVPVRP